MSNILDYKEYLDKSSQRHRPNAYLYNIFIKTSKRLYEKLLDVVTYINVLLSKVIQKQANLKNSAASLGIFEQFKQIFEDITKCAKSSSTECKKKLKAYYVMFRFHSEKIKEIFNCAIKELESRLKIMNSLYSDIVNEGEIKYISERISYIKSIFDDTICDFKENKHTWFWYFVFTIVIILCVMSIIGIIFLVISNWVIADYYWSITEPKKRSHLKYIGMLLNPYTYFKIF